MMEYSWSMIKKQRLSKEQAYQKIKHFVLYQERCHQEVKDKLYTYGLYQNEVEGLISQLIEEDLLNEERFAEAFAGGKFRMKKWGKVKIRYELKLKRISEYCIRKALNSIDEDEYEVTLSNLARKRWQDLEKESKQFIRRGRLLNYLIAKGYEIDLCKKVIDTVQA